MLFAALVRATAIDAAEPAAEAAWKFVVLGDSRGSGSPEINVRILTELAAAIAAESPELLLFTGDLAIGPGTRAKFEAWTNALGPVYAAGIRVYPVRGNHDLGDDEAWIEIFGKTIPGNGPPGQKGFTYAVPYRNTLFLGLDTCSSVSPRWIEALLATNRLPHVFAFGHQPAFRTAHADSLDADVPARDAFWKALRTAGGRVYFCAHDHFYNRARLDDGDGNTANDLHQIILGTAGAPLRDTWRYDGDNGPWTPVNECHESAYGYMLVALDGPRVTLTWKHRAAPAAYVKAEEFSYTIGSPPAK